MMVVKNTFCSSGTYVIKNKFTSKLAKIVEALTREEPCQGVDVTNVLKVDQQA